MNVCSYAGEKVAIAARRFKYKAGCHERVRTEGQYHGPSCSIALLLAGRFGAIATILGALLCPAGAQVSATGTQSPEKLAFNSQKPTADKNHEYNWSLCQGKAIDKEQIESSRRQLYGKDKGSDKDSGFNPNTECGGPFNPAHGVQGGNPPYHFQLDTMGGFPPFGIHLDLNGNLTGTISKGARGSKFRVCAVDMSAESSCQTLEIKAPSSGTSHTVRNVAIAGGAAAVGVGAAAALASKSSTGNNCSALGNQCTSLSNQCLNGVSSACSQVNSACSQFCSCEGLSNFNVNTGSCQ